jgi:hypothetical protein
MTTKTMNIGIRALFYKIEKLVAKVGHASLLFLMVTVETVSAKEESIELRAPSIVMLNCGEFKGQDFLRETAGVVSSSDDGYSQQEIIFIVPTFKETTDQKALALWKGQNTRTDQLKLEHQFTSKETNVFSYSSSFTDVFRTYSLFLYPKYDIYSASFTEAQTQLFTGLQQTRTFMSKCSVILAG